MVIKRIPADFTVCKVRSLSGICMESEFLFIGKTDDELSLVCPTCDVPDDTLEREDSWRAFRIEGVLDFSLVGILAKISSVLAENGIGLFAVSTYNTDYILVKRENFDRAMSALASSGYTIV